jgi:hypothetical protein
LRANRTAAERGREPRSPSLIVGGFVISYALIAASQMFEEDSQALLRVALSLPAFIILMATLHASKGRVKPAKSTDGSVDAVEEVGFP